MKDSTLLLLIAAGAVWYFATRSPASASQVSGPSTYMDRTMTSTQSQQIAEIQSLQQQLAQANASAAAELSYAAADVAQPGYITGGVAHQLPTLIGLGGWRV